MIFNIGEGRSEVVIEVKELGCDLLVVVTGGIFT